MPLLCKLIFLPLTPIIWYKIVSFSLKALKSRLDLMGIEEAVGWINIISLIQRCRVFWNFSNNKYVRSCWVYLRISERTIRIVSILAYIARIRTRTHAQTHAKAISIRSMWQWQCKANERTNTTTTTTPVASERLDKKSRILCASCVVYACIYTFVYWTQLVIDLLNTLTHIHMLHYLNDHSRILLFRSAGEKTEHTREICFLMKIFIYTYWGERKITWLCHIFIGISFALNFFIWFSV